MELNKQVTTNMLSVDYRQWIVGLKERIRQSQIKAAVKVNSELLHLYWQMGSEIVAKQKNTQWGDGFLKQLSKDLMAEFPEMKGFSVRNLQLICKWYLFYNQENIIAKQVVSQIKKNEFGKQAVSQYEETFFSVPWGHHILIMQRCKEMDMALFYIRQTVEKNWSRTVLDWQMDSKLYERQGKAISNFLRTLPLPQSDLAQQITKDPYIIDLMGVRQDMEEREIENYLDTHISRFLLELGRGFTFYGRQVELKVAKDSFYVDLLFYHVRLHCYVVVELKAVKFKPEHVGQLNFYVTAVDNQMRTEGDNPTIGLLICKEKMMWSPSIHYVALRLLSAFRPCRFMNN